MSTSSSSIRVSTGRVDAERRRAAPARTRRRPRPAPRSGSLRSPFLSFVPSAPWPPLVPPRSVPPLRSSPPERPPPPPPRPRPPRRRRRSAGAAPPSASPASASPASASPGRRAVASSRSATARPASGPANGTDRRVAATAACSRTAPALPPGFSRDTGLHPGPDPGVLAAEEPRPSAPGAPGTRPRPRPRRADPARRRARRRPSRLSSPPIPSGRQRLRFFLLRRPSAVAAWVVARPPSWPGPSGPGRRWCCWLPGPVGLGRWRQLEERAQPARRLLGGADGRLGLRRRPQAVVVDDRLGRGQPSSWRPAPAWAPVDRRRCRRWSTSRLSASIASCRRRASRPLVVPWPMDDGPTRAVGRSPLAGRGARSCSPEVEHQTGGEPEREDAEDDRQHLHHHGHLLVGCGRALLGLAGLHEAGEHRPAQRG